MDNEDEFLRGRNMDKLLDLDKVDMGGSDLLHIQAGMLDGDKIHAQMARVGDRAHTSSEHHGLHDRIRVEGDDDAVRLLVHGEGDMKVGSLGAVGEDEVGDLAGVAEAYADHGGEVRPKHRGDDWVGLVVEVHGHVDVVVGRGHVDVVVERDVEGLEDE